MTTKNLPATTAGAALVASLATEGGAMTVEQLLANRDLVRRVMRECMVEGLHYGKIPGTPKPSLWKAGAELLCVVFLVDAVPRIEDLSDEDCIRYRIYMEGVHFPTGRVVAHAVGECSTNEDKFKWRAANNRHEFAETPQDRRRWKYGKSDDENDGVNQVRTNPADAANTVLKMAEKRAKVGLAFAFAAVSDIFTQGVEDLEEWLRPKEEGDVPRTGKYVGGKSAARNKPQQKQTPTDPKLTEQQLTHLRREADKAGVAESVLALKYSLEDLADMTFSQLNGALGYIKSLHESEK